MLPICLLACCLPVLIAGCHRQSAPMPAAPATAAATSFYADTFERNPSVAELTELGRRLFADPLLSESGKIACSTCHDPRHAYGPANDQSVQPGGRTLAEAGTRAAPSLRYLQNVPPFSEHHFDEAVDESADQGPTGGHTWDGRADTVHDQARLPLLSRLEMANDSAEAVAAKVAAHYAPELQATFGPHVLDDPQQVFKAVLKSLEVFQQSPADFYPFSSRYDAWLRRQGQLSAAERRGLALFNDARKGNCASCHPSELRQGSLPLFTDFGFIALAVPRNRTIPANANPRYFDLGLCGPERQDLRDRGEYCGLFRAPTLRNVAVRHTFFHNGVFHSLRQVLEFYVQRDLRPAKWYHAAEAHGTPRYDDLPEANYGNVNREPPFDRTSGQAPALDAAEIGDVIAFLNTLTDADLQGKQPAQP